MEKQKETEKLAIRKITSIFDWPLTPEEIARVYCNFYAIIYESIKAETNDWHFFSDITKLDIAQRKDYRNKIADLGHELRPDELNQYICIIMLVMIDVEKEIREENGKTL
jgi:hypothetical protein